jgi:hypothetical protein
MISRALSEGKRKKSLFRIHGNMFYINMCVSGGSPSIFDHLGVSI